jgi:tRNA(fMet)-specific endonuclease VapC
MFCLDTNVVVRLLNGRSPALRRRFEAERLAGRRLSLSAVALHELRFGAANSERPTENARALDRFLDDEIEVLAFGPEDATEAGAIRAHLRTRGTLIGPCDILIAAQARRRGATLVTGNTREFARVPRLLVVDWAVA